MHGKAVFRSKPICCSAYSRSRLLSGKTLAIVCLTEMPWPWRMTRDSTRCVDGCAQISADQRFSAAAKLPQFEFSTPVTLPRDVALKLGTDAIDATSTLNGISYRNVHFARTIRGKPGRSPVLLQISTLASLIYPNQISINCS